MGIMTAYLIVNYADDDPGGDQQYRKWVGCTLGVGIDCCSMPS
jgi:hypothetical protein